MFTTIQQNTATRLTEVRRLIAFIRTSEKDSPSEAKTLRGVIFVMLYGIIEYTISQSVQVLIQEITKFNVKFNNLEQIFYTVALDSQFTSLSGVVGDKKWLKRKEILIQQQADAICRLQDTLFNDQLQNVRYETLQNLFECFCISDPVVPDLRLSGYINDVVDRRNEIAHGSLSAQVVGVRRTTGELETILNSIAQILDHVVDCFERSLKQKAFIAAAFRANY